MAPPPKNSLKVQPKNVTRRSKEEREALDKADAERARRRARMSLEDAATQEAEMKARYGVSARERPEANFRGGGGGGRGARGGRGGRGGFTEQTRQASEQQSNLLEPRAAASGLQRFAAQIGAGMEDPLSASDAAQQGSSREGPGKLGAGNSSKIKPDPDVEASVDTSVKSYPDSGNATHNQATGLLVDQEDFIRHRIDIDDYYPSEESSSGRDAHRMLQPESLGIRNSIDKDDLFPVRIRRVEHEDTVRDINVEASMANLGKKGSKEVWQSRDSGEELGAASESGRKGKQPATSGDEVIDDAEGDTRMMDVNLDIEAKEDHEDGTETHAQTIGGNSQSKAASSKTKSTKSFSEMDRLEDEQILRDRETMLRTMRSMTSQDSDLHMNEESTLNKRKLYIFQFPPVMPELVPAGKTENNKDSDVAMIDDNDTQNIEDGLPTPKNKLPYREKTANVKMEIKDENDGTQEGPNGEPEGESQQTFPPGYVGKLRIFKSGRAELDWGGIPMDVQVGIESSVAQSILATEMEPLAGYPDQYTGHAIPLGQVHGKFVVTPSMKEMFGVDT